MQKTFKRGIFDRYDGWRIRNVDALFNVIPFILRSRLDSQNMFEESIPLEPLESFVRKLREEMPEVSYMHILIAALVRIVALRPYLNRFIVWNKVYARNSITLSLAIKRALTEKGEETVVKIEFEPPDTIYDVARRISEAVNSNKVEGAQNDSDTISKIMGFFPAFLMRFVIWVIRSLDNIGSLPRFLFDASPWHASMFLTNMGSLGIGPIYHHLYEFGTCSIFMAMGNKTRIHTVSETGEREVRRFIGLKINIDERICDGLYFATSIKQFRHILARPETLLTPPEFVAVDDGVGKKRIDGK